MKLSESPVPFNRSLATVGLRVVILEQPKDFFRASVLCHQTTSNIGMVTSATTRPVFW